MVGALKVFCFGPQGQIRVLNEYNPSLQDNPGYQTEYEAILATLEHVIHIGKMHGLLTELQDA